MKDFISKKETKSGLNVYSPSDKFPPVELSSLRELKMTG